MKSPWKWTSSPEPEREYLVLASSIPPRSRRSTWRLFRGASAVRKQLAGTDGLIGFALLARHLASNTPRCRCGVTRMLSRPSPAPSRTAS